MSFCADALGFNYRVCFRHLRYLQGARVASGIHSRLVYLANLYESIETGEKRIQCRS